MPFLLLLLLCVRVFVCVLMPPVRTVIIVIKT